MPEFRENSLYYGDNLTVLRDFPDACVDLVYLDPPFNSKRSYNVIFREAEGAEAEAQIEAFDDSWHWTAETAALYDEVAAAGDDVGRLLQAFVEALGHNDMTAYLTMMAPRLLELRRVMKPTASLYLHCDPTASHYLKVLMDAVFGGERFLNEIVWKRMSSHNDARRWGRIHDSLLFYSSEGRFTWTGKARVPYSPEYLEQAYSNKDSRGRYTTSPLQARSLTGGGYSYEYKGIKDIWKFPLERLKELDANDLIHWPQKEGGIPRRKVYLDEAKGIPVQDVITDIEALRSSTPEGLGYPTQKPEALLARIIEASSNRGDVVLDPFCGCGTAVVAAHRLGRTWIGIDVTFLAVDLMRTRLEDTFPDDFREGVAVDGEPADEAGALALAERDKFQFQFWAVAKLGGTSRTGKNRRGPDQGIDGVTTFPERDPEAAAPITLDHRQVVISVKGGATSVGDVRDLRGVVEREEAAIGVLVTAGKRSPQMVAEARAAGLYRSEWHDSSHPRIQILTAGEIVHGARIDMPARGGMRQYQRAPAARERGEQGGFSDV